MIVVSNRSPVVNSHMTCPKDCVIHRPRFPCREWGLGMRPLWPDALTNSSSMTVIMSFLLNLGSKATPSFSRKAGGLGIRWHVTIPSTRSTTFEIIIGGFLTCLLIWLYSGILPPEVTKTWVTNEITAGTPRNKVHYYCKMCIINSISGWFQVKCYSCRCVPAPPIFFL